ncbi:MAG: EAL domain-containing protein [Ectothiorhodospiraceae bacterium]
MESKAPTRSFSTTELNALLACTNDHVFVVDSHGTVHRRSPGNDNPSPLDDPTVPPADQQALQEAVTACLGEGGPREVSYIRQVDGAPYHHCRARLARAGTDRVLLAVDPGSAPGVQEARLANGYAVERLFGSLSRAFINVSPDQIDPAIATALEQTAVYCGAARAYIYELREDGHTLVCHHAWRRDREDTTPAPPSTLDSAEQQAYLDELRNGSPLRFPGPYGEAAGLPECLREQGVSTAILAPVAYSGTLRGFLGVDSPDPNPGWAADEVHVAARVSELLASALQRKRSEQHILRLAYYDSLTGLPNRQLLRRHLTDRLAKTDTPLALALVDLDDASTLNDVMGHALGDELLCAVSERLQGFVGRGELLARWGGDAFMLTLCLPDDDRPDVVESALDDIRRLLSAPVAVADHELRISACLGAACYPRHGGEINELIRFTELALDDAKDRGRDSVSVFQAPMEHQALCRSRIEHRLRIALEEHHFTLHYQPQITLATDGLAGLEGLIRWFDPVLGEVLPDRFIELAEATGLIVPIGQWVIEQACRDLAAWRAHGLEVPVVAINIAVQQLLDPELPETLRRTLAHYGVPGEALELEITESALMDREASAIACLQQLRALGVGLAVDDFGTGYSSLRQIKQLPITKLKIDRSFIHDILSDADDRAIVVAVIAMAHQLGLPVVAEGVEHSEQLDLLRRHGCDIIQGHLHGPADTPGAVLHRSVADPAFGPRV